MLVKARGMFDAALQAWATVLSTRSSTEGEAGGGLPNQRASRIPTSRILSEMASALQGAAHAPGGADLLRNYIPNILAIEPTAVLPVFTACKRPGVLGTGALAVDEVLELLHGHVDLVQAFLEQFVHGQDDVEAKHFLQLALVYLARVEGEQAQGEAGSLALSPMRQKLVRFLQEAAQVDVQTLLPRVEALRLHEEKVVLCSRDERHQEALHILVVSLNDLPRAEVYCRLAMARQHCQQKQHAKQAPPIFCMEPPAWARGIVFGRRASMGADSQDAGAVAGDIMSGSSPEAGGKGPLIFFLMVLLDAAVGAELRPSEYRKVAAEYKDAALSLLMGYAGHGDLSPQEVIGLLPAAWPLDCVAGYLTKCARICLHGRRSSMFEENLSSMAYLKTFNAWAHERTRKVTITRDSCCFKCTRRFVDKDCVGKAFVAYPNETCVHLQCKEDLSVCPKTGQSFADNFSVYCHALSEDSAERR